MTNSFDNKINNFPKNSGKTGKYSRVAMNIASGAIPLVGGVFSAASAAWSENEQTKVNKFLEQWLKMIQDEIAEKEQTIIEITGRLDLHDENILSRIASPEYQSLLKKTFRDWSGAEDAEKRVYIRNILSNAAIADISSDDVVRLYLDWINNYSNLHFIVISEIYQNSDGISRGSIWTNIGKPKVKENSADADLYKLLFRDLSTGSIVRQYRKTDYRGNFIKSERTKKNSSAILKSAFDKEELYILTELGKQFIHYAMTDLPLKVTFNDDRFS